MQGFRGVIVACVSHAGIQPATGAMLAEFQARGAIVLSRVGNSDVAAARNLTLTQVLDETEGGRAAECDMVLLVDDDMVADANDVERMLDRSRATGLPHSGVYCTAAAALAATTWRDGLYLAGLGMMAVPTERLRDLARKLDTIKAFQDLDMIPFCKSGPIGNRWVSEDYYLCMQLGGVHLDHNVPCGHIKPVPLWPDDETLARIGDGRLLGTGNAPNPRRKAP